MSKLMNAENIHGLAPNRQFSLMPYSISELRGVSQRLNDGDKSGLRAVSHSSTLRGRTGDSIKLSKTTLDHSEKSFWSREGQLIWGQERSQQSEVPLHSCYTAAKFVGRVDGKNLPVKRCFSKSAQIGPLSCSRNKWSCRKKQGWGVLSTNCPLSL